MNLNDITRDIPEAQSIVKTAESVSFRVERLNSRQMTALVEMGFWFDLTPDVLDNGRRGILVVVSR